MDVLELRRRKDIVRFAGMLLAASAAFLLIVEGTSRYLKGGPDPSAIPWIAAAPIVGLMVLMVVAMRSVQRMDELERKIHVEAMAFAFLCSFFILCSAGFLALAGLLTLSLDWIAPTMGLSWNVGIVLNIMRYR